MLTACRGCENGPGRDESPGRSHDHGPDGPPYGVSSRACYDGETASGPGEESDRYHHGDHGRGRTRSAMKPREEYEPTVLSRVRIKKEKGKKVAVS